MIISIYIAFVFVFLQRCLSFNITSTYDAALLIRQKDDLVASLLDEPEMGEKLLEEMSRLNMAIGSLNFIVSSPRHKMVRKCIPLLKELIKEDRPLYLRNVKPLNDIEIKFQYGFFPGQVEVYKRLLTEAKKLKTKMKIIDKKNIFMKSKVITFEGV